MRSSSRATGVLFWHRLKFCCTSTFRLLHRWVWSTIGTASWKLTISGWTRNVHIYCELFSTPTASALTNNIDFILRALSSASTISFQLTDLERVREAIAFNDMPKCKFNTTQSLEESKLTLTAVCVNQSLNCYENSTAWPQYRSLLNFHSHRLEWELSVVWNNCDRLVLKFSMLS